MFEAGLWFAHDESGDLSFSSSVRYLCSSGVSGGVWARADQRAARRVHRSPVNGSSSPFPVWNPRWKPFQRQCDTSLALFWNSIASDETCVVLQEAKHLRSSHTPTPPWTTWWPTTMRRQRAWQTCPRPAWGSRATPESTCSSITSPKGRVRSAAWAASGGKPSMAVWSVPVLDRTTCVCMPCPALTCGTNHSGETLRIFLLVTNTKISQTDGFKAHFYRIF